MLPNKPVDVILCHFGGPASQSEVEPFLFELFNDPMIIRAPLGGLRPALARYISRKRVAHTDAQYKSIGYSPINRYTEAQAKNLEKLLCTTRPDSKVHVINRYTAPRPADVIGKIRWQSAEVVVMTLYPHFCHSTTASAFLDLDTNLQSTFGHKDQPTTRIYSWWFHPRFLSLTLEYLRQGVVQALARSQKISVLFSAHGIPVRYKQRGDPYTHEVLAHFTRLKTMLMALPEASGWSQRLQFDLSFQSRVGRMEWVKPYTNDMIVELGREAKSDGILLVPISFVSDHIETLYEMDDMYQKLALTSGFNTYDRVQLPNEKLDLAECLKEIVLGHI